MTTGLGRGASGIAVLSPELLPGGQNLVQRGPVGEEGARWRWWWGYDGVVLESWGRLGQVLWGDGKGRGRVRELKGRRWRWRTLWWRRDVVRAGGVGH